MNKAACRLTHAVLAAVLMVPVLGSAVHASEDPVAEGERLMAEGNPKKALKAFEKAGGSGEALVGVAWANNELGKRDKAAEAARKAAAASADPAVTARANYQLGVALLGDGGDGKDSSGLAGAAEAFKKALEPAGAENRARIGLASVAMRQNDPGQALAQAREYLAQDPASADSKEARKLLCRAKQLAPAGTPAASTVAAASLSDAKPQMIDQPSPNFSDKALRKAQGTKLTVKAMIDEEGCLKDVKVEGATPEVNTLMAAVVERWVFQPGRQGGRPVAWPILTEYLIAEPRDKGMPRDMYRPIHQAPSQ